MSLIKATSIETLYVDSIHALQGITLEIRPLYLGMASETAPEKGWPFYAERRRWRCL